MKKEKFLITLNNKDKTLVLSFFIHTIENTPDWLWQTDDNRFGVCDITLDTIDDDLNPLKHCIYNSIDKIVEKENIKTYIESSIEKTGIRSLNELKENEVLRVQQIPNFILSDINEYIQKTNTYNNVVNL